MEFASNLFSDTNVISLTYVAFVLLIFGTFTVMTITFLLLYWWCRDREKILVREYGGMANLLKERQLCEADIEEMKKYAERNKDELLQMESERKLQEDKRQEILDLQQQLAAIDQRLDEKNQELASATEYILKKEKAEAEIKAIEQRLQELQEKKGEINALELQLEEKKNTLADYVQKIAESDVKLNTLIGEISQREQMMKETNIQFEQLQEKKNKIQADIIPLEDAYVQVDRARKDRDDLQEKLDVLRESVQLLEEKEAKVRKYVEENEGQFVDDEKIVKKQYSGLCSGDVPEFQKYSHAQTEDISETAKLSTFKQKLADVGLFFSERVIYSFHTSLKINDITPLVVLAGISGTGKTLLPIKYAEFMGIHCLPVSVQPRWDSPSDLFGFFNHLEKKYTETELARMLVRMDRYHFLQDQEGKTITKYSDRLLLVLLDEMNLARVEYYFSEMLSKLELRRTVHKKEDIHAAAVELSMGPNCPKEYQRLWIGRNILFVGTMNEDESTQTLSDKVLDRANVLRFGRPAKHELAIVSNKSIANGKHLTFETWKKFQKPIEKSTIWYKQAKEWICNINDSMSGVGRPFGYRVEEAILTYLANYPGINANFKRAFADQLEQKIIPKLRGLDTTDEAADICLGSIAAIIQECEDAELTESFNKSKDNAEYKGMFQWHGVERKNLIVEQQNNRAQEINV